MLTEARIIKQGSNYHVQHGTDAGLYVQFYIESVHDEEASEKAGRQIYKDRDYIKIMPAGDRNTVICRPVCLVQKGDTPPDNIRWPNQYDAFKRQQEQPLEGTPVTEWPPLSKAAAMNLKSANVHTVEQLAEVSDQNLYNLGMGARSLREKAKIYLQTAKEGAVPLAAQKEIEDLKKQIEALQNQMAGYKKHKPKKGNKKDE